MNDAMIRERSPFVWVAAASALQRYRPAELLLDSSGTVRWVNYTEDYRVRARPEQILTAARGLQ